MARAKKEAKILNIKLSEPISVQLEKFCGETGITKTMATEKILSQFLDEYFERDETERKIFK
ncbi:MAG: hypothetical protein KH366_03100 [Clostridiaceae bacterium]|nr:hypothetical protein [Clostridiaceae bacterium]